MEVSYTTPQKSSPYFTSLASHLGKDLRPVCTQISKTVNSFPHANGVAGNLPQNWVSKINVSSKAEKQALKAEIFQAFRGAVDLLREGRMKEASVLITDKLRLCGILPKDNKLLFKRRHVKGSKLDYAFITKEYGKNPTLEKLFIKSFKPIDPMTVEADFHGLNAELLRGFFVNRKMKNDPHIVKTYWGDFKGNFMASEYVLPPSGKYEKPKEMNFWTYLAKFGLQHGDLHDGNVIIGSHKGRPVWKLIDLGGLGVHYIPKQST